jgi:C_GCAxxG_C_C family probable redox protein
LADAPQDGVRAAAGNLFESGFLCAESVLLAIARAEGIESDLLPGVATAFCSGQARTCGACGALNGALLAVGMILGRSTPEDSLAPAYAAAEAVIADFEKEFGSRDCRTLLDGIDLGQPEGRARFEELGLKRRCLNIVGSAAAMAERAVSRIRTTTEPS